jgi:ABC-2 type transport system ATP-binding protein
MPDAFGVNGLTVRFGHVTALNDVSLDVRPGQVTAVVGGDGAGKSTLLSVLAHRVRAESGDVRTVERERLGYQPATSGVWPTLTVAENVEFVGRSYGMPGSRIRARSADLLERAGLVAARNRLGQALSGGMRQKLGFVLAILHEPELVLLDEPSTGVDPVSRVELWRLISTTASEGAAVLMATTYLDEAQRAASVLALEGGRMLAAGTPEEIVASVPATIVRLDDVRGALAGAPQDALAADVQTWRRGTERHAWIPAADIVSAGGFTDSGDVREWVPIARPDFEDALIALSLAASSVSAAHSAAPAHSDATPRPARHLSSQNRRGSQNPLGSQTTPSSQTTLGSPTSLNSATTLSEPRESKGPTAAAVHITKRFGRHTALDDVGIDVRPGEVVGLIGANGAGKTTLLRILLGLESADAGDATLFGAAPDNASRRRLGYVPQGLGLYTNLSVRENVEFFSRVYGIPKSQLNDALPPSLQEVQSAVVGAIGLGRQRQLAFALALGHEPELLVLDEPTSGVDPLARARLWDVIHSQADAGRAVIVTTHYLQEAEQCTRLVLLSQGRLVGTGIVADLVRGASAVLVRSDDWQRAFEALDRSGLPIMLNGRDVRVASRGAVDALGEQVRGALAGIPASIEPVPPTLEETMVLLDDGAARGVDGDDGGDGTGVRAGAGA